MLRPFSCSRENAKAFVNTRWLGFVTARSLLAAVLFLFSTSLFGQDTTSWDFGDGFYWNDPGSWDGPPPTDGVRAVFSPSIFSSSEAYAVVAGEGGADGLDVLDGFVTIAGDELGDQDSLLFSSTSNSVAVSGDETDLFFQEIDVTALGRVDVNNGGRMSLLSISTNSTQLTNTLGSIGANGDGFMTVSGPNSLWRNTAGLQIGSSAGNSQGTLNIDRGGEVSVTGTTTLGDTGSINLFDGRLEFGAMSAGEFSRINAISGSMSGSVSHSGYTDVSDLTSFQTGNVDIQDVNLVNSGVLFGNANLGSSLTNTSTGQLEVVSGERMRFAGQGVNAGEINNFGGLYRFQGSVANESTGLISGRGQFIADGGWTNDGVIATSGGFADFHGDLNNSDRGTIAVGGGSVATFYDDVLMDADNMNINVAANSTAVFFGSYNGGSDGFGDVHVFGDLRPGNSPGVVTFGGDLELGSETLSSFELEGSSLGNFDRLEIAGDFYLDGFLEVSTLAGFEIPMGGEFIIADVGGNLFGQFRDLDEGDLVGDFSGQHLFISYRSGDGNDVALFSAVPEPGSAFLLLAGAIGYGLRRRKVA